MSNNVHRHEAYEILYESGSVSYVSYTTPDSVNSECVIPAPVKYVVPIIFIPGIMGSNIKDTADDKEVWYPRISLSTIIEYSKRDARERQIALNPATTQVGYDGDVKISKKSNSAYDQRLGFGTRLGFSDYHGLCKFTDLFGE